MNSLYTLGLRQTASINGDLEKLRSGENTSSLQGQISASLAAFNRTIDDYESMAKKEVVKTKQEKALMRVSKFRTDATELRLEFDRVKEHVANMASDTCRFESGICINAYMQKAKANRNDLLGDVPQTATRQRFNSSNAPNGYENSENPFAASAQPSYGLREDHVLREHSFIDSTENQLDAFIAQGREVLDNLVDQRNILKGTQRRLLDAANTLGLSRDVIGWVERRTTQDTIIFVLTLDVIVDNSIEWMTKLPPGFTHEVKADLTQRNPPFDKRTGVPILDLDNFCCGERPLEYPLTSSVDWNNTTEARGETHRVLFDTGPEAKSITRNLSALQTPVESIERIVLSHWHRDHSGGIVAALEQIALARAKSPPEDGSIENSSSATKTTPTVVDLHPDRPIARGIAPPPTEKVICRLPEDPTHADILAAGGVVETHSDGHSVANKTVWVSGEIPRLTGFETGLLGGARWREFHSTLSEEVTGDWAPEPDIMDERYVAVDVLGKGLVVLSACSHAGICNVIHSATTTFPGRPIYAVIGGLHLAGPELQDRIGPTVDFIAERLVPSPTYVLPMHCTGFNAKVALSNALGEAVVPAGTGMRIEFAGGNAQEDSRLMGARIQD
ncbi:metallo-beta-lactamase superfamily protein [Ceratobasidium sp. AG-Ba]|nr:metallo-beta-lactamase superfamily protein [Ceratobasidium sp. AG-Ba]